MADSANSLLPPNAGDYQRMGLRAEEFRPMVIRRALEQSAQPLALMHLRSPSEELERMLLDLLVGAYRVLDPRRRQDPQSRVMLGRLHPQLADEAVQLAQARLAAPQSPSLNALLPPPVEGEGGRGTENGGRWTEDGQGAPIAERSATLERFIDTAMVPGWEETLSAPDLLVQLPTTRAYRAARRQFANAPLASVIAIAVLAGSVLLLSSWWAVACWRSSDGPEMQAAEADLALPVVASTLPRVEIAAGQAEAWSPIAQAEGWTPTAQAEGWTPTGQAEGWTSTEQPEGWTPTAQAEGWTPTAQPEGWTPTAATDELALPAEPAASDTQPVIAASARLDVPTVGLAALDQDLSPDLLAELESLAVPEVAGDIGDEADIAAALPAVPPPSQQAAARLHVETRVRSYRSQAAEVESDDTQLVTAEPALGPGLAEGLVGVERQIELLRAVASEAPAGSAERWVATVLAGQAALLADRTEDTQQAIAELTQSFAIDADEATLYLAQWTAGDILSSSQRQRVGEWLDEQVRAFVLSGELAVAGQLVGIAHELGAKHRDEAIKAQSKLWRDSLAVAQRYAEAAERLDMLGADQASAEERATVGRYWALVRRDWHRALSHLAAGSNAKLAQYAGIELLAGAVPDAEDATFLADGYLTESKRAKGWLSDSYVLHAYELLVAASKAAGQTEALELAQAAEKLRAEQPAAFVGMAVTQATQTVGTTKAEQPAGPQPIGPQSLGAVPATSVVQPQEAVMLGRLRVAGQDIGALVRYQPGVTLSTRLVDQIASQLNISPEALALGAGSVELEFVGVLRIEQPTTVLLSLVPLSNGATQSLSIHGQPLTSDLAVNSPKALRYSVDLLRGEYLVRWVVAPAAEDRMGLRVTDQASGEALKIAPPPATLPGSPERMPTTVRVGLVEG